jgi:hypothetical protein
MMCQQPGMQLLHCEFVHVTHCPTVPGLLLQLGVHEEGMCGSECWGAEPLHLPRLAGSCRTAATSTAIFWGRWAGPTCFTVVSHPRMCSCRVAVPLLVPMRFWRRGITPANAAFACCCDVVRSETHPRKASCAVGKANAWCSGASCAGGDAACGRWVSSDLTRLSRRAQKSTKVLKGVIDGCWHAARRLLHL